MIRLLRHLAVALLLTPVLVPAIALAEPPATVPRIAVVLPPVAESPLEAGLRDGLRELGYVEGKNIIIDWRSSAGTDEEMATLSAELAKWKLDAIVVSSTPVARAALRLTATPVIFAPVSDPVGTGLVASLGRPGGNATGISLPLTDLTAKRFEILHLLTPGARRIGCLANSSNPAGRLQVREAETAARKLSLQLIKFEARNNVELDNVLARITHKAVDGVVVTGDLLFLTKRSQISHAMSKARIPAIVAAREFLDDGALISYGPSARDASRRAAAYVDKILRGSKASDLPIEEVSKFEMVVNLRVARSIGVVVPEELLLRADEVVQ